MTPAPMKTARKCADPACDKAISPHMPFCATHMAWRCEAHNLTTSGDCPTCDDEMILALPDRRDELGHCHTCAHWKATHCNVDGFSYCDEHYPEDLR